MIISRSLTPVSRDKVTLLNITGSPQPLNPTLTQLLNRMIKAFENEIPLTCPRQIDTTQLQTLFKEFNRETNKIRHSKFERDLLTMSHSITLAMREITVHFLYDTLPVNLIATIMHALWIFYQVFPYNYSNLTIYVCLDHHTRDLLTTMDEMRQASAAFNVSGMTQRSSHVIYLTRQEEIIKLMFHELAHYLEFDGELMDFKVGNFNYCIQLHNLKLYEAYSEFLSVIFNSAYQAIRLSTVYHITAHQLYQQLLFLETRYSLVLTSRILRFYGYHDNYRDFFYYCETSRNARKKTSPISVWEYVFLRASLMQHLDEVCRLAPDFRVTETNRNEIVELMQLDYHLVNELANYMDSVMTNVAYTLIDVVWD